jgi:hypothetical protein
MLMVRKTLLLLVLVATVAAVCGVTLVARGQEGEKPGAKKPSAVRALTPEQRREMRLARQPVKRRFDNVRFATASAVSGRGEALKAPPSTTVIEYDANGPVLRSGNTSGVVVGNQFNVGGGGLPITGPWTITGFIVQNAGPNFLSAATIAFFGGPGAGTTAPLLGVFGADLTGGLQAFGLPTFLTGTGSFLGGVVNSTWFGCTVTSAPPATTTCDGVALDTAQNATNPLGFHAMSIAASSPTAGGFNTLGNLNAIFKVTGASLPIELMSFSVASDD